MSNRVENREERVRESYSTEWITRRKARRLGGAWSWWGKKQDHTAHSIGGRKDVKASWNQTKQGIQEPTEIQGRTESIEDWREQEIYWKPSCFSFCIQCSSIPDWILLSTSERAEGKSKFTAVSLQPAPHEQESRAKKRHWEGRTILAQADYSW